MRGPSPSVVGVRVSPLTTPSELESIHPLIGGYRAFYAQPPASAERLRYLERFLAPSDDGVLLAAYDEEDDAPVGFACVHWRRSSFGLRDNAYLSDLFVAERARGGGAGRALLEASLAAARERGLDELQLLTEVDNRTAQRLYERFDGDRSAVFEYGLRT